jgi:hypothetical protein
MELRTAEGKINEIRNLYTFLREKRCDLNLPPLLCAAIVGDFNGDQVSVDGFFDDPKSILSTLEEIRVDMSNLEPKIAKIKARCQGLDPVTGMPRYGPATLTRVSALLESHSDLNRAILTVFGEDTTSLSSDGPVILQVRLQAQQQDEEEQLRINDDKVRQERELAIKRAQDERTLEELRQRQRERHELEERDRQDRARQYAESRLAERQLATAAEQADRDWLDGITRGPDGVRKQLETLLKATEDDPGSQEIAVKSLYIIYQQITSKPEDPNFRRIRREHEKFNSDVGRHTGGKELLIASGFELGAIDDVPSFISKEPNIEQDMDGWSSWFELLKETLQIIEDQFLKTSRKR